MYKPPVIEEWKYSYPDWAHVMGILIAVFPLTFIPTVAIVEYCKQKGKFKRVRITILLWNVDKD